MVYLEWEILPSLPLSLDEYTDNYKFYQLHLKYNCYIEPQLWNSPISWASSSRIKSELRVSPSFPFWFFGAFEHYRFFHGYHLTGFPCLQSLSSLIHPATCFYHTPVYKPTSLPPYTFQMASSPIHQLALYCLSNLASIVHQKTSSALVPSICLCLPCATTHTKLLLILLPLLSVLPTPGKPTSRWFYVLTKKKKRDIPSSSAFLPWFFESI